MLYLGRPAFDPRPHTRLAPIAQAEDGRWRAYGDWSKALPPDGRVFAPRLPGFHEGELLAFGVEPNPRPEAGRDEYVVIDPQRVAEVLDFREHGAEAARRALVEKGTASLVPGTDGIVAALPGNVCVVSKMVRHPTENRWVADIHGLDRCETFAFDARLFEGDRISGRWIAVPGVSIGGPVGTVNWCRDADFLESFLKRLRRVAQGVTPLTRAQVTQVVGYLGRADLLPATGDDLSAFKERFEVFAPSMRANAATLDEIVALLGSLRPIEERLEAEMVARRSQLEAELRAELAVGIRAELQRDMTHLTTDRDALAADVDRLSAQVADARDALGELNAEATATRSVLRDELSAVLSTLGETPTTTEIRELAERLRARLPAHGDVIAAVSAAGPPWAAVTTDVPPAAGWETFAETSAKAAKRFGYDPGALLVADVAARAGKLVVLPEGAVDFVSAYADTIAGGEVIRHVLDPAVMSADDLWFRPASERMTPFAIAWTLARHDPRRFRIVLLDGMHRTPMDLWAPTFAGLLDDDRRPSNLLVFGSLGGAFIDRDRIWRELGTNSLPLAPERSSTMTLRTRARATGRPLSHTLFDAEAAPGPAPDEMREWLETWEERCDARRLEWLAACYRAAWASKANFEPGGVAASIVGVADSPIDAGLSARIAEGDAWLRELLTDHH